MKKLFTLIFTVAMIALTSTAIFAAETPTDNTTQPAQVSAQKKAQRTEFKALVQPLRDERKANKEENMALREQNKSLVTQIQSKLATIKASETKMTEDQKTDLKAIKSEVKSIRAEIKATHGQIKAILDANKDNLKNMDLTAVQAAFNQVYDIQNLRHQKLQAISDNLNKILTSLN